MNGSHLLHGEQPLSLTSTVAKVAYLRRALHDYHILVVEVLCNLFVFKATVLLIWLDGVCSSWLRVLFLGHCFKFGLAFQHQVAVLVDQVATHQLNIFLCWLDVLELALFLAPN